MRSIQSISKKANIEVLSHPHGLCSIQELPGRRGFWAVGVPPSGPMDERSFVAANRLVQNVNEAATLELTECGLTLLFGADTFFSVTGAEMHLLLNGMMIPFNTRLQARSGDILRFGALKGAGFRAYLAVRGGFESAMVLGSRSTFVRGGLGTIGEKGTQFKIGDLPVHVLDFPVVTPLSNQWILKVRIGPHALPEYISKESLDTLLSASWKVTTQLDRTGIRLSGPKPKWARKSGGIAGLNPSNVMDTPYTIGALNFMGDTAVITGPDGPSLGGFCSLFCVESEDLWKLGQMAPDDNVTFQVISDRCELGRLHEPHYQVRYLQCGDHGVLVEYGPEELNLELRMRVHMLREALVQAKIVGVVELSPGVRGLLVDFDSSLISTSALINQLKAIERKLTSKAYPAIPARRIKLPLSWEDPLVIYAVQRYTQSLGADAEWCPDNIEFVRKINGFESKEALRKFFFETEFLVLGLGDVYLGAPLAIAKDPTRRLRSTKYNPARTWTPEGAVGLGGQYLCIYGMESPGGYQLVGRTLPTWKRGMERSGNQFNWFDSISFYPVSSEKLDQQIKAFKDGELVPEIEPTIFDWNQLEDKA